MSILAKTLRDQDQELLSRQENRVNASRCETNISLLVLSFLTSILKLSEYGRRRVTNFLSCLDVRLLVNYEALIRLFVENEA